MKRSLSAFTLAVVTAVLGLGAATEAADAGPEKEKELRQGPLAGLPSAAGPHIEKIKALGDNQWLNLGSPAADPKWGKARGRSWCPHMPYAPELKAAFLCGEGVHDFIKPDGRSMNDLFAYEVN